jgi:transposase InsO family protein
MAPGLHGSARTTPRVRAELQAAQATTRALAASYGLNPKTVAKWRGRTTTADRPMGPSRARSSVLTEAEEAIVVEFHRRTLLPLDDVLGCLRDAIPKLIASALHRCLVHHGISRLPRDEATAAKRQRFAETRIGYVHIDVCELRLAQGKLFMFLAIDRVSKFAHVAFFDANTKVNGAAFLRQVVAVFPYRIHTVPTDNGMAFADLSKNRGRYPEMGAVFDGHIFDRVCDGHGIQHRLTKPCHPWTNGQVERMNRTVKEATIKAFHYPDPEALRAHVLAFVTAYNFAKHLKALRWRTPFQAVCDAWEADPSSSRSTRTTSSRDHTGQGRVMHLTPPSAHQRCRPRRSLLSTPRRAIRRTMPRCRQVWRDAD